MKPVFKALALGLISAGLTLTTAEAHGQDRYDRYGREVLPDVRDARDIRETRDRHREYLRNAGESDMCPPPSSGAVHEEYWPLINGRAIDDGSAGWWCASIWPGTRVSKHSMQTVGAGETFGDYYGLMESTIALPNGPKTMSVFWTWKSVPGQGKTLFKTVCDDAVMGPGKYGSLEPKGCRHTPRRTAMAVKAGQYGRR